MGFEVSTEFEINIRRRAIVEYTLIRWHYRCASLEFESSLVIVMRD